MHRFPPPPMLPPPNLPNIPNSWMNDDDFPRFDQQQLPIQPPQQQSQPDDPAKKKLPPPLMSLKIDKPGSNEKTEVVLPKALEDALALTTQRIQLNEVPSQQNQQAYSDYLNDVDDDSDEELGVAQPAAAKSESRSDKNRKKKQRKKQKRQERMAQRQENQENQQEEEKEKEPVEKEKSSSKKKRGTVEVEKVEIEYVPERVTVADLAPMYRQFYRVFEIFKLENKPKEVLPPVQTPEEIKAAKKLAEKNYDDDDDMDEDNDDKKDDKDRLSKRKMKKLTRLSVAELKQLVNRPDVVEMHDVTARDPKLLVQLKAHRNTVQVPRHWCFKRKYLQGKRGIEKPPFDLPAFIKKTGIMEMRASLQEKDEAKTLKAKMREKIRPKMGKIDIDYQKLHDAFFKWQTKPRMTIHGDLYYEGKEFETRLKEKKPGDLSEELRTSLGMPIGPSCHKIPPPWLIAQQRYGPPPSYPNLKIPGLNAPIPEGCSFGYHAGGWGKPPVDESGKPLYGDVFGTSHLDNDVSFNLISLIFTILLNYLLCSRAALAMKTSTEPCGVNLSQNLRNLQRKKKKTAKTLPVPRPMKAVWWHQPD